MRLFTITKFKSTCSDEKINFQPMIINAQIHTVNITKNMVYNLLRCFHLKEVKISHWIRMTRQQKKTINRFMYRLEGIVSFDQENVVMVIEVLINVQQV
jgi:hypothetical protein